MNIQKSCATCTLLRTTQEPMLAFSCSKVPSRRIESQSGLFFSNGQLVNGCPDHQDASASGTPVMIPLELHISTDGDVRLVWFGGLGGNDLVALLSAGKLLSNNGHGPAMEFEQYVHQVILRAKGSNPLGLPEDDNEHR